MRCFIGFFGLTRSLPHTAGAIRTGFYEPLQQAGLTTLRAGHFNLPPTITNPRSGEFGVLPDRADSALLELDLCWIEPQVQTTITAEFELARSFPDTFGDQYRSLANLCHQLRSLECVWSLLELLGAKEDDLVLLLRPDLLYLDMLEPLRHLAPLLDKSADLVVPSWQSWGGLNDRFAFCSGRRRNCTRPASGCSVRRAWRCAACMPKVSCATWRNATGCGWPQPICGPCGCAPTGGLPATTCR